MVPARVSMSRPAARGLPRSALTARPHSPMLRATGVPEMLLNWLLIIVGAVCVLTEVAMGGFAGFDLVLIGSAVALGGFIGLIVGQPIVGLTVAAVLSLLYIALGRRKSGAPPPSGALRAPSRRARWSWSKTWTVSHSW